MTRTPDIRHLVVRDVTNYLMLKGLPYLAAEGHANNLLAALEMIAYEAMWEKPAGCVCGGPSDPYHGFCDPCAERRNLTPHH